MTQDTAIQNADNNEDTQDAQGFIAAEVEANEAPADLTVCSTGEVDVTSENVDKIELDGNMLVITMKDGSEVTIEDFKGMMAASGITELTLADGTVINLRALDIATAEEAGEEGEGEAVSEAASADADESAEEVIAAVNAPAEDNLETAIKEGVQEKTSVAEDVVEQVAEIAPAAGEEAPAAGANAGDLASIAEQLASIETAAGDAGTGTPGASGRGGFGFDSSTDAVRSVPLNAIGPIGPTALQYGIDQQRDETFLLEDPILPPSLSVNGGVDNAIVKEDGSIFIPIIASLQGPNLAAQVLTITISGVDAATAATGGFLPTAVPGTFSQTLPAGEDYNGGITVTPAAQSDVDLGQFSVVATATIPGTDQIESTSDDATVITDAVADKPEVDGLDANTFVNNPLDVDITGMLGADNFDDSEEITGYTITSATDLSGFTFNNGVYNPLTNTLTLDAADLAGLEVTPPVDFKGSVDLTVTIFNEETNLSDTEDDASDNTNTASDTFTLTWVPGPVIKYEFSTEVDGDTGLVKEDSSVTMQLDVENAADVGPVDGDEILTVTISGLDSDWVIDLPGQSGAVWTETAPGTFAITLPAGEDYSGLLTFTPPADSDLDHPVFTITADVFDQVLNETQSDSATADILTDAVIDTPSLTLNAASGEEGTSIPLDIFAAIGETQNVSETITGLEITNIPAGATLSAGTYDIGTDTWSLDLADLAGLTIDVPNGITGVFDLSVTVISSEDVGAGDETNGEVDLTDNTTSVTKELQLTVTGDTEPEIKVGNVDVDESNFHAQSSLVKQGTLVVDFGDDTLGSIEANTTVPTGLTSMGQPVEVVGSGNVYTATNTVTNDVVFTLTLKEDGSYEYEQFKVLDHAEGTAEDDAFDMTFGVTAKDNEGDAQTATFKVTVYDDEPVANDDVSTYDKETGAASGNVITGENGGPGAADDLSADEANTVLSVNGTDVPANGDDVQIVGTYGILTINNTGAYTYEATSVPQEKTNVLSLQPVKSDVDGTIENTLSKGGVTVSVANAGNFDLTWLDTSDGSGLGIDNLDAPQDSLKAYSQNGIHETFNIAFDEDVSIATITIAELGDNNDNGDKGADYVITFADGSTYEGEVQFATDQIVDGIFEFTLNSQDFDGKLISSIDLASVNAGDYNRSSFLLNNVKGCVFKPVCVEEEFDYILQDGDGDTDAATLTIQCAKVAPGVLIVGENVSDVQGEDTPWAVGDGNGQIEGMSGPDILIGDVGGSELENRDQDYNFLFVLDTSKSMTEAGATGGETKLQLLKDALKNLMNDFAAYENGVIKVHFAPFSTDALSTATFTITDAAELQASIDWLENLPTDVFTNFEAGLQSGINWLQSGELLPDAVTTTYFLSDGEPNRYLNSEGNVGKGLGKNGLAGEINGLRDGSDEISLLNNLSDNVISIGLDLASSTDSLDSIDQDGDAILITDPNDLDIVLAGTSPFAKLLNVGDDTLEGDEGEDIIFGDAVNTDDLADAQGLTTNKGAGWAVFERLENGEGLDASWSREDTLAYIRDNAEELAAESVDEEGGTRDGGGDTITGGDGDDMIFGQEGDDVINGGLGDDDIYGGSGADTFLFEDNAGNDNTIGDFDVDAGDIVDFSAMVNGYGSEIDDAIGDFVKFTEIGGDTVVAINADGSGDDTDFENVVTLIGVTGLDFEALETNGALVA